MRKLIVGNEWFFVYAIIILIVDFFVMAKSNDALKKSQINGTEVEFREAPNPTEFDIVGNKTLVKMFDDITTKVWRVLPVVDVPRNWVLPYCLRFTEIYEEIEKATMLCQYDGTDWDCTFIEIGGGQDNFSMARIVTLFNDLSNQELRYKLLQGAEVCGKFWQRYWRTRERRLLRMRLNMNPKLNRKKRYSKKGRPSTKPASKRSKKKNNVKKSKKKEGQNLGKVKTIRDELSSRATELEKQEFLTSEEETELGRLHLLLATRSIRPNLEESVAIEQRAELTRLREIGSCLSRQAMKACEPIILKEIEKLL